MADFQIWQIWPLTYTQLALKLAFTLVRSHLLTQASLDPPHSTAAEWTTTTFHLTMETTTQEDPNLMTQGPDQVLTDSQASINHLNITDLGSQATNRLQAGRKLVLFGLVRLTLQLFLNGALISWNGTGFCMETLLLLRSLQKVWLKHLHHLVVQSSWVSRIM